MKIKNAIINSVDVDANDKLFPICFAEFLINFSEIIVYITSMLLKSENVTDAMISSVLVGNDFVRRTGLFVQVHQFLRWFIEQDEPEEFDEEGEVNDEMWYDCGFIAQKWNEWVTQVKSGDNE